MRIHFGGRRVAGREREANGGGVNRANTGKWERGGIYGVGEEGLGGQQNHKFQTK